MTEKDTENQDEPIGKTTIAPSVISTVANLTTLAVPGVSRMSDTLQFTFPDNEGVKLEIKDQQIYLDLYVIITNEYNARLLAETIQQRVYRAITETFELEVARINVHIMNVDIEA